MLERGLQLFVVCFIGIAVGRPQLDVQILDEYQAAILKDFVEHEIVVPYRVDHNGMFLSHNLLHHRTKRNSKTGEIHYHVPLKNENFHLTLTPNEDFLAPHMKVEWRSRRLTLPVRNCHFIGSLKNHTRSSVAISNCEGLAGLIRTSGGKEYFIEPVFGIDVEEHDGKHPHVVYRRSIGTKSANNETEPKCGVTVEDAQARPYTHPEKPKHEEKGFYLKRTRRSVSLIKNIEVLLVADHTMVEYYANRDLENYLFTIMNMVSLVFRHRSIGSAINIVLVRMIVLEKDNEDGLHVSNHARKSLNSFCTWVQKINPVSDQNPLHADAAMFVTRRDICRDSYEPCQTLGLSNIDGLCSKGSECSYNEDSGFSLVYTLAHELGHNLGILHDDDYSSCSKLRSHVMASTLVVNPAENVWSKCSRKAVKSFFYKGWGWCLNDRPGSDILPKRRSMLPGQVYDADHQCKVTFGYNSTVCIGAESIVCKSLWCVFSNGNCATKASSGDHRPDFAALEGTSCGKTKWCIRGRCQRIEALKNPVDGNWGEWLQWGSCSKTCGRGVRRRIRKCNYPKPEYGGSFCVGEWKKYDICNVQPCRKGSTSSLQIQCEKFRRFLIHGRRYEWTARQSYYNPCELRCVPLIKKGRSRIRKFIQAEDGTPCNHGTINICIRGKCEHVGCDNKLHSSAREDRCGVCRGDGGSCKTIQDEFYEPYGKGYTDAVVIPAGARNIRIGEVSGSPNFLALKSSKGDYFLNGNWYIQWGGMYNVAGTNGLYSRRHNRETFKAKGPIKEDLHVVLLYQGKNPGITIQYDIKRNNQSFVKRRVFRWHYGVWSRCSVTCGQGTRRRTANCVNEKTHVVDTQHCMPKPAIVQKICNRNDCPPSWWIGFWHECSKTCGTGIKFRPVLCTQVVKDRREAVGDDKCRGSKPARTMSCQQPLCWTVYPWSNCSSSCQTGVQQRHVRCPTGGASKCDIKTKPSTNRTCIGRSCLQWIVGEWGECSVTCGNGTRSRRVSCEDGMEEKCDRDKKPPAHQTCPGFSCPTWEAGDWSHCSVTCGKGTQKRSVECKNSQATLTCSASEKPSTVRPCLQKRCSGWMVEKWGSCSTSCGEGVKERKVVCTFMKGCTVATRPSHKEVCLIRDCPEWLMGEWSECSASCGEGKKHRNVTCSEKTALCPEVAKPTTIQACVLSECSMWNLGNWSECSVSCGTGIQTRSIGCISIIQSLCENNTPETEKQCQRDPCGEWKTTEWSKCPKGCDASVQTRRVYCSGSSCDPKSKPDSSRPCHNKECAVWVTGNWGQCSEACGEGVQARQVYCSDDDESKCNSVEMPESTRDCFVSRCFEWIITPWEACSARCGQGLTKRNVTCGHPYGNCSLARKPRALKICLQPACSKWGTGPWSSCSVTCGPGFKRRIVSCNGGRCLTSKKPPSTKVCHRRVCPEWRVGNWSECSTSCGDGYQVRNMSCGIGNTLVCDESLKPDVKRPCRSSPCPDWFAGPWSNCSASCGQGNQTRNVTCITETNHPCVNTTKPDTMKNCISGQCPKWVTGNWTSCSATCGGGTRMRIITCHGGSTGNCSVLTEPVSSQSCGEVACPQWFAGGWGECSKTCGGGTQSRSVTCQNNHVGKCLEKDQPENTKKCGTLPCPKWFVGEWSKCSKTCGGGTQSRSITCQNSRVGKCLEKDQPKKTEKCGTAPCPKWSVGEWSKCSKTCGGGTQSRSIACQNSHVGKCLEKDQPEKTKHCGELPCPQWSTGEWSECSKTCGGGTKSRNVTCQNSHVGKCLEKDQPEKTKQCGGLPCPQWSTGEWSKCSKTCGGGTKSRSVTCQNSHVGKCLEKDQPEKNKQCGELPCPQWSTGEWSKCSKTCGGGTQSRSIACQNSHVGKCLEKDQPEKNKQCGELPCPQWSTGEWSKCSKTCGCGTKSRSVTCQNSHVGKCLEKDQPEKNKQCGELPCPQWSTGEWSKCSKTCGGGTQSRSIACQNSHVGKCLEKDQPEKNKQCGELPCPQWSTGEWSKCSKTCGGGTQSRSIACQNSHVGKCLEKDQPEKNKQCGELPCPQWSTGEWSKCSKTCGGGTKSRSVTCQNSHVGKCLEKDQPEKNKQCGELPCPQWSTGEWSKCSKTCGGGTQSRSIACQNSHVGKCLEKDQPEKNKQCGELPCPQWSTGEWSKCSKTCGCGTKSRSVTCQNSHVGKCLEKDQPEKNKQCGELPCPQWSTGEWSKCSKTCGGGTQSRSIACQNSHVGKCLEKDQPEKNKQCGELPCPQWSTGKWSKCSKTCGGGTQSRSIACQNSHVGKCLEKDQPEKNKQCGELPCPLWSTGEWSKCSKTCGGGTQSRSIACQNSHVGKCLKKDQLEKTKKCGTASCPKWFAGEWSECSKTCGGGTQSRSIACENSHVGKCLEKDQPETTKKCGTAPCPKWSVGRWGECSKTCDGGTKSRSVTCQNSHVGKCLEKDQPEKNKQCGELPCPQWSTGEWSKCSKTCGGGTQSRSIACQNSHVGKCLEKDQPEKTKQCGELPCPQWSTGEWSKCSKTCGGGTQSRSIACQNSHVGKCLEKDQPEKNKQCGELPCPQWSTGEWSKCSKTCGGGTQSRSIACQNSHVGKCLEKDQPEKNKQCGELPCPQWRIGEWSKCSKTCGGGTQSRSIACQNSHVGKCLEKDQPEKTKKCGTPPCPKWFVGRWSKCSKTCGGGTQSRSIACQNSHVGKCLKKDQPEKTKKCGTAPCPKWFAGEWSECSKTCGGGTQSRSIACENSHVGKCLEKDQPETTKKCREVPCPKWSFGEWKRCSKTCGSGERVREVVCSGGKNSVCNGVKPATRERCNSDSCPVWIVSEWSKCAIKRCGHGKRYRSVTCSRNNTRKCNRAERPAARESCKVVCPEWWVSEWGECQGTCTNAKTKRRVWCEGGNRKCKWNKRPRESKFCSLLSCLIWSVGNWNACPVTCGGGITARDVHCRNKETKKITPGCDKAAKPFRMQACALFECPKTEGIVTETSPKGCYQAEYDRYFCQLFSQPSLNQLCLYKYWKSRCCETCSAINAKRKLLKK